MTSVTVLLPNARRVTVKVSPSTLLSQILTEASLSGGFDCSLFDLQTASRKRVDLSLPWRLTGLPNNVTLEMVPRAVPVHTVDQSIDIALQLPSGDRKMLKLSSASTLFEMLAKFEKDFGQNLTLEIEGQSPCLVYNSCRYAGADQLRSSTLNSLGINSGRVLMRFMWTPLSEEDKSKIRAQLVDDQKKRATLNAQYEKAKLENEERDKIQREIEERFAREQVEREAADARLRQEREQLISPMEVDAVPGTLSTHIGGYDNGFSGRRDILSDVPVANPNGWSFDSPVFCIQPQQEQQHPPTSDSHISQLNRLLERVDHSLAGPNSMDNLVEIVANEGRLPLSQIAQIAEAIPEPSPQALESPVVVEPCDRKPIIFVKEKALTDVTDPLSDEFFEIKVDDLKSIQKDLREDVRQQTQRALLPKAFVHSKNKELKRAAYKNTVIRLLTGESVIQLLFHSIEPTSRLIDFIRLQVSSPNVKFNFMLASIKLDLGEKNFIDLDLAPKATLILKSPDINAEALLNEFLMRIPSSTQQEADRIGKEWLSTNTQFKPFTGVVLAEEPRQVKRPPDALERDSEDKRHRPAAPHSELPKWLGKKK